MKLSHLRGIGPRPAVVLGLNPNALASVRALARSGVPVVTISPAPGGWNDVHGWMSGRTRFARKIFLDPSSWLEQLPDVLLACTKYWEGPAVIIPSGDLEVAVLQKHRLQLAPHFRITLPDERLTDLFADKSALGAFAKERGVPAPQALIGMTPDGLRDAMASVRLPCIVKPPIRNAVWDKRFGGRKALECSTAAELMKAFTAAYESHHDLIVQEMIPGGDDQLVFSHTFIGLDGRELAMWTGHKVRQLPIHFGTSTCVRTTRDAEAEILTRKLLADVGFVGYASVEFKVDSRDGSRRVIEITAGRTWYPHGAGIAAGVNIPLIWYRDALGLAQEQHGAQASDVVWIDEVRDIYAASDYMRAGELTISEWRHSLGARRAYAHFAWDDPMPGIFASVRLVAAGVAFARRRVAGAMRGS